MEAVESTVKSVQGSGTWDSQYGTLYSFEYEFEDGTVLKANHKTPNPFNPGDQVEYTVTKENEYGKLGKVQKFQNDKHKFMATGKTKNSNGSFALSYAKDIVVSLSGQYSDPEAMADDALRIAERLNVWLINH